MKRRFPLATVLGGCLIVLSLAFALLLHLHLQSGTAKMAETASLLGELTGEAMAGSTESDAAMPVLELDGTDYVALLELPEYSLTLPVANTWDSRALTRCPARFCGSAYDGTLVIGGFDHPDFFGFCEKIGQGAAVTVTDLTGSTFTYTVTRVDRAKHAHAPWLTEDDSDLTLFCRSLFSLDYIAVRCQKKPN